MTLEGGKLLEVYSQVLRDHPGNLAAVRFHFRDVTQHREMESKIRGHEEQVRQMQKRAKQLEKELAERDRQREQMDAKLLEHQDRLRELHQAQQGHESSLQSSKEEMRKLAGSVANDINGVISVILGNTDVLRDNLPPDHVAQHYLNDIHQAASQGTQLSQRLCDWTLPEPETTEPPQSDRAAA
jgi:signal transduction histidine kinase